jgi:oligopeptide transport system substrate-binding protein
VPRKTVEQFGNQWTRPGNIVVNGPFIPIEWIPQASLTIARNPKYWDAAHTKLDRIIYYPTENIGEEFKRFRAGELDITYQVPPEQADFIRTNMADVYKNGPFLGSYFYVINLTRPPLGGDIRLRRALALAIDRDIIVGKVLRRGETPSFSLLPTGIPGYTPAQMPEAQWTQSQREAEAKRLYAAAGYGPDKPLAVEILYNTNDEHKRTAIAVGAMWRKVLGVQLQLTNQEWKVYLQSMNQALFQVARRGWIADYSDPVTYLDMHLSNAGGRNGPKYKNPVYDKLVADAGQAASLDDRMRLFHDAEQVFLNDVPIIPIYQYVTKRLVATRVKGFMSNALDIYPSRTLSVEP